MSIWSGKRKHLDHHFWTKSEKMATCPFGVENVSIWTTSLAQNVPICHPFRRSENHKKRLVFQWFGDMWWKRKATDTVWPFFRFCHFWSKSDGPNAYVFHSKSTWCPMVTFASQKYNFSLGKIGGLRKWNFHFCTYRFGVGICKLNLMFFGSRNDEMATCRKVV